MIEKIIHNNVLLSIIIRASYSSSDINFFTPSNFSQQLAYMNREKGYEIAPHIHNPVKRDVNITQEVLFIRKGKVKVDYYDDDKIYLEIKNII